VIYQNLYIGIMKHIKKIDELYKSTLLRAHDALKWQHPKRAINLKKWAEEKGESEFSKFDSERIWPYKFVFSNNSRLADVSGDFLGSFSIIDIEENDRVATDYFGVKVFMMNEFGQKVLISFSCNYNERNMSMKIVFGNSGKIFLFENRKDALQFKKFLLEEGLEHLNMKKEIGIVSNISINKLFRTE